MYWKITKDHLVDGTYITEDRTGLKTKGLPKGELLKCKLYDDDGELYYEAVSDDEGLESLFDWTQRDVGVTLLRTFENGKWVDCIG